MMRAQAQIVYQSPFRRVDFVLLDRDHPVVGRNAFFEHILQGGLGANTWWFPLHRDRCTNVCRNVDWRGALLLRRHVPKFLASCFSKTNKLTKQSIGPSKFPQKYVPKSEAQKHSLKWWKTHQTGFGKLSPKKRKPQNTSFKLQTQLEIHHGPKTNKQTLPKTVWCEFQVGCLRLWR